MMHDIKNSIALIFCLLFCGAYFNSSAQIKIYVSFKDPKLSKKIENFNFDLYYMSRPNDFKFVEKINEQTFIIRNDTLIKKMLIPVDSSKHFFRDDTLMFMVKNNYYIYFIPVSVKHLLKSTRGHYIKICKREKPFKLIISGIFSFHAKPLFYSSSGSWESGTRSNSIIRKRTSDRQPWFIDWYITDQFKIFPDSIYNPEW